MNCSKVTKKPTITLKQLDDSQFLINYIVQCPAIFQSQQIGDPDLNLEEKKQIAEDLLYNKPVNFLIRFGKYLKEDHLNFFTNNYKNSYEVLYYVKNFKKLLCESTKRVLKRNRRFEAMIKMEKSGTYFTEKEMEKRDPVLYHIMVGQYLNDHEKLMKYKEYHANVIPTFSNFLIEKLEKEEQNEIINKFYEEESNDYRFTFELSKNNIEEKNGIGQKWAADWDDKDFNKKTYLEKLLKKKQVLSSKEKNFLYQEFKSYIQNKFLNGEDSDFDYSEIDSNPDYDSLEIAEQDEEDKYFDEETSENDGRCTDTGIEDY